MAIARRRNIAVLEDCAQCNGGSFAGQKIGDSLPADSNHSTDPIVIDAKTFIINTAGWAQGKSWGTYRTEDGGATWAKVADFGCSGRALLANDGTIYWGLGWRGKRGQELFVRSTLRAVPAKGS